MARPCPTCGEPMPDEDVLCSLSHTIIPGERICSECGRKETTDPVWTEGRRVGFRRAECCPRVDAMIAEKFKKEC